MSVGQNGDRAGINKPALMIQPHNPGVPCAWRSSKRGSNHRNQKLTSLAEEIIAGMSGAGEVTTYFDD